MRPARPPTERCGRHFYAASSPARAGENIPVKQFSLIILGCLSTCGAAVAADGAVASRFAMQPMRSISAADSLLIVAPHPDDESLCCAGLIDLAQRAGARVAIVWITDGDGSRANAMVIGRTLMPGRTGYRELGRRREGEARAAAGILGVAPDRQFFLGYPDRGILPLVMRHFESPWRSPRTGATAVLLEDAVTPGSAYEGRLLERDLTGIVERVNPTIVLAPSPLDAHPDHRGAGLLSMRVMSELGHLDRIHYWIVHGGPAWPTPRALRPDLPQTVPPRGHSMVWEFVDLDAQARTVKQKAIDAHLSPRRMMARVMDSHVRATEIFARTPGAPREIFCLQKSCIAAQDGNADAGRTATPAGL
jgi:LmbE family N-acetylglucosaminyl deacetylase